MKVRTALLTAISLTLVASLVSAQGQGKGLNKEGASVSVATVCNLDGSNFSVEMRVRDETSGDAVAGVYGWEVTALAKTGKGNWSNGETTKLGTKYEDGLKLLVPITIYSKSYRLCVPNSLGTYVIDPMIFDEAKALNAMVEVTYGRMVKDEWENLIVDQRRTVINQCSDDPETLDVEEPDGIGLDFDKLMMIEQDCVAYSLGLTTSDTATSDTTTSDTTTTDTTTPDTTTPDTTTPDTATSDTTTSDTTTSDTTTSDTT